MLRICCSIISRHDPKRSPRPVKCDLVIGIVNPKQVCKLTVRHVDRHMQQGRLPCRRQRRTKTSVFVLLCKNCAQEKYCTGNVKSMFSVQKLNCFSHNISHKKHYQRSSLYSLVPLCKIVSQRKVWRFKPFSGSKKKLWSWKYSWGKLSSRSAAENLES